MIKIRLLISMAVAAISCSSLEAAKSVQECREMYKWQFTKVRGCIKGLDIDAPSGGGNAPGQDAVETTTPTKRFREKVIPLNNPDKTS